MNTAYGHGRIHSWNDVKHAVTTFARPTTLVVEKMRIVKDMMDYLQVLGILRAHARLMRQTKDEQHIADEIERLRRVSHAMLNRIANHYGSSKRNVRSLTPSLRSNLRHAALQSHSFIEP